MALLFLIVLNYGYAYYVVTNWLFMIKQKEKYIGVSWCVHNSSLVIGRMKVP